MNAHHRTVLLIMHRLWSVLVTWYSRFFPCTKLVGSEGGWSLNCLFVFDVIMWFRPGGDLALQQGNCTRKRDLTCQQHYLVLYIYHVMRQNLLGELHLLVVQLNGYKQKKRNKRAKNESKLVYLNIPDRTSPSQVCWTITLRLPQGRFNETKYIECM